MTALTLSLMSRIGDDRAGDPAMLELRLEATRRPTPSARWSTPSSRGQAQEGR
ncbi:hypothetical protein [Actinoallomurus sp. CA-142502]|uniref:hypothetical protein n=1 Tax=Actinoallomurus sp. CA-142502 TaxID=3239885 RepID=UPI003D93BC97